MEDTRTGDLFTSNGDEGRPIEDHASHAYLGYAVSTVKARALPEIADGLKPVQRRILYAMWEAGLRPDRPYRKCASAVGDVMKKYHPHGDTSIYDALVRMAQDFSMREPLVDGHGNFGSVDGDSPAAMRYTEARLSSIAMEMLAGIDEGTVDFVPNYDGYESEPVVLPGRFPNLLVNGSSGIAVGMATNVPPHNLTEAIDACLLLIRKPKASLEALMKVLPAPDFPTGARIVDTPGIRDAYVSGRGAVTVEAVATTETRSGGLPRIIVTEIPYQVNKAALLERIADLVKDRKVEAIRDLRDESSRDGMRIVVELKRGEDPARVLQRLYRLTDLRTNFNVNCVALVGGQPRTLGLRELLDTYLVHQRQVLTRRTSFRRDRAAARAHVLEGLLVALEHLDDVIALIRSSDTPDEARGELMRRYDLTEIQANAILDMQLRRLAALERQKIADEHEELLSLIAELEAVLADAKKLDKLLASELTELKTRHGNPRRSRIVAPGPVEEDDTADTALPELEAQPVTVYVTAGGYLKPVAQRRASKPHSNSRDPLVAVARATTADTLLLVDADGGGYRLALADVPVTTMRQRGTSLAQLLGEPPDAAIVGAVRLSGDVESVVTVSAGGQVKRTAREEYEGRTRAMIASGVRDKDRIAAVAACGEADHLVVAHDGGQVLRFAAAEVRLMGRSATGVGGIKVPTGKQVVSLSVVHGGDADRSVLTVAADGIAKQAPLGDYPVKGRGGKGVQAGADPLAWCGLATDLHVPTADGWAVLQAAEAPLTRRTGRGAPVTGPVAGQAVPEGTAGE
jgi:DNA gyrase subunit A